MRAAIPRFELERDYGSSLMRALRAMHRGGGGPRVEAPERYRIRRDGRTRFLFCIEAPTIQVQLERGLEFTAAEARAAAPGSIFLDGAARGEPFLDPEHGLYNLDHHEGCARPFTLSTCEQAMVLVRRGLDLRRRDWTVYANDADLDTLLAIWILLNHLRLGGEDPALRARVMPLVRLQGTIDAQGLEFLDLCALPPELLRETRARMDRIRERELALRTRGRWEDLDLPEYALERLRALDTLLYEPRELQQVQEIEELERFAIGPDSLGLVCRASVGIYEVERELRRLHGGRLGLVVLQRDAATYSLRKSDPNLPASLERIYERLNLVDPAAGGSRSANRWGGSSEIGGSPRASGTRLGAHRIGAECERALRRPPLVGCLARVVLGAAQVMALAAGAHLLGKLEAIERALHAPAARFALPFVALVTACYLLAARRAPGLQALRPPVGVQGIALLPLALLGAAAGGVIAPAGVLDAPSLLGVATAVALPLASELLFRGLLHGLLAARLPIQRPHGPRFVSVPALLSSLLYAGFCLALQQRGLAFPLAPLSVPHPLLGPLLFGLAAALARERSESIAVPVLYHALGLAALLLAR